MSNDKDFDVDTEKALELSIGTMRIEEREFLNLKRSTPMSDLEEFQEREKRYCRDLKMAINQSKRENEDFLRKKEVQTDSNRHFDTVFTPSLYALTSLSFEAFCVVILRGYSNRCGSCAIYRDKRYQSTTSLEENQDAIHDFCPHLICSEWTFVAKMRSISKVFWERFLKTRPGRHFSICLPKCKFCYWTSIYDCGSSKKNHDVPPRLKLEMIDPNDDDLFTPKCLCVSKSAEYNLRTWCKKIGLSESRVQVKNCFCGRKFQKI